MSNLEKLKKIEELSLITTALDRHRGKDDIPFFVERFCKIEDRDATEIIVPFLLWEEQRRALKSIHESRLNIVLKARQLGLTWLALCYAVHEMVYKAGFFTIALSRSEKEAMELIRRTEVVLSSMPELIKEYKHTTPEWSGPIYEKNSLNIKITFPNGLISTIEAFPSAPSAGRSFTANLILSDEMAFQQFAREIWYAGFPSINRKNGGKVIIISTMERGSFFEELFQEDNDFNKVFLGCFADPRRDQEWYDKTKRAIGDAILQEYPRTVEEAFLIPGGSFFPEYNDETHICKSYISEGSKYLSIDYGLDMLAVYWIVVNEKGNGTVYRELFKENILNIQAAKLIKQMSEGENIVLRFAPKDLWHRNATGSTTAEVFEREGVPLFQVSNSVEQGLRNVKEWLRPDPEPKLKILNGVAPNLINSLRNIQKDKNNPNVTAKQPHKLTHAIDSLRYFASGRPMVIKAEQSEEDPYESLFNYGRT